MMDHVYSLKAKDRIVRFIVSSVRVVVSLVEKRDMKALYKGNIWLGSSAGSGTTACAWVGVEAGSEIGLDGKAGLLVIIWRMEVKCVYVKAKVKRIEATIWRCRY